MDYISQIELIKENSQIDMYIYSCDVLNIQAMQENAVSETIRKGWEAIIKAIKTAWGWFKEKVLAAYNFIKQKLTRNKNTINEVKENFKQASSTNSSSNGGGTNSNVFNKSLTRKRLVYNKRGRFLSLIMKCDRDIKVVEPYLINPLLNKFDKKMTRDQLYDYFTTVARSTSLLAKKGGIITNKDIIEEDIFEDVILLKDSSLSNIDQFFEEEKFDSISQDIINIIEKENNDFESMLNGFNQDYRNINDLYKKIDKFANDQLKIKSPDEGQKYYQKAVTTCVKVVAEISKMINAATVSLNTALDINDNFLKEVNEVLKG